MSTVQDPRRAVSDERDEPDLPDLGQWWGDVRRRVTEALTTSDVWALRLIALHLLPVAALVVTGGLYIDDLRAQVYASGRGWWPFVVESNATHLAPSARTVDWLQATFLPLQHGPAVVVTLIIHAALGLAFWGVLRELGAARPVALPFLLLALLQPGMLPATAWYRQSLTTLAGLTLTLVAVAFVLHAERTGRWALPAAIATICIGVGAGFSERALAGIPLAVALLVVRRALASSPARSPRAAPRPPAPWRRVRWLRAVPAVAGMCTAAAVFALAYRSEEYAHGGASDADWWNYPRLIATSLVRDIVPPVLGGPWRWSPVEPSYALADPPMALVVAADVLVGLLLLAALVRRSTRGRAVAAGAAFAAYALPVWFLLFLGRFASGIVAAADDLRLWPDIGTVLLLCVAVAVGARHPAPAPARRAAPSRQQTRRRPVALAPIAVVGLLVVVGGTISWIGFADRWSQNEGSDYVDTLRATLPRTAGVILPSAVPPEVVPGWVQADLTTSQLVGLLDPRRLSTVVDGTPLAVDDHGRVRRARLTVRGRASAPAGSGFCGFHRPGTSQGWLVVPFDQPVPYYRASMVRVPVLLNDTATVRARVVDPDGRTVDLGVVAPELERGPHVLMLLLPYRTDVTELQVTIDAMTPLCVPSAEVVTASADR